MTPRGVKPWFAVILLGGLVLAAVAFQTMLHHRKPAAPQQVAINTNRGTDWWDRVKTPTTTPTPPAPPLPYPTQAMMTPPVPLYQPQAKGTPDEDARERHQRYLKALQAGPMLPHNTEETPQLIHTGDTPSEIMVNPKPAPPHTVTAWTWIYGTLETGISSDHPGDVLARVSQNVMDSVTQTEVLIPMGSKLHGTQGGREMVQQADTSIIVTWDDIELPNGAHIPIPHMPGEDSAGYPGFSDLVDHHYAKTWVPAILMSGIASASALASHPTYGGYQGYSPEQQALTAGASQLSGHANAQLSQDLSQTKPTLTIRPGYLIRILTTRDLVFNGVYR